MFTLFLPTISKESLENPPNIIRDFRFRIIESPSKQIRDFNDNDVDESRMSEPPPPIDPTEVEDLSYMKMPVKQFY